MFREGLHPIDSETERRALKRRSATLAAVALVLVGLGRRALGGHTFGRVIVSGESMLPAFEPGDRLLLCPAWRVKVGQVVALPDPRGRTGLLIKRVHSISGRLVDVRGDNAAASTDSRTFGPVPRSQLSGRVLYRYAPSERTGVWPE